MDEVDQAQLISDKYLAGEIARAVGVVNGGGESQRFCVDCWGEIPEARRPRTRLADRVFTPLNSQ